LVEVLGPRIKKGLIIVKKGQYGKLDQIRVVEAGHPLPDEEGMKGAEDVVEIANEAKKGDLVFCAITGGASAMMPIPVEGVSLGDLRDLTDLLLKSGASVNEINSVRKHVSAISGGGLAMQIHPAEIINLIVVDEVASRPWGPTVPDVTTFKDAKIILKKYNLWGRVPLSIRRHLQTGLANPNLETPKPADFENLKVHNIILADNRIACEMAKKKADALGLNSLILSTVLEGESLHVGTVLASIAREIEENGRPISPPCALITGGETTVTISGKSSRGGPSQELALSFALRIEGSAKIVFASVDTDGTDGPTDVAGGIVDGETVERAKDMRLDIYGSLMKHDSFNVLTKLKDGIFTGSTGTNVMDLDVTLVLE
jgi:glycerate-2-kinase